MIIYRGVKNILFKNIHPLFRNDDDSLLDYGKATSYAYEKQLAQEYCEFGRHVRYSWLLTYEFTPKNPLTLTSYNTIDDDGFEHGVFFKDGTIVPRKNLADYAVKLGHDSIIFEYDENDPHIMLLENCTEDQLQLTEALLFSENQEIVTKLQKNKLAFDGQYFTIPLAKIKAFDHILEK